MVASRRQKTPRSEVKDNLLLKETAVARLSAFSCRVPESQFLQGNG